MGDLSDDDAEHPLQHRYWQHTFTDLDQQLAIRLQQEQEDTVDCAYRQPACSSRLQVDTSNDEKLALRLQREEEERAAGHHLDRTGKRQRVDAAQDSCVLGRSGSPAALVRRHSASIGTGFSDVRTPETDATCSNAVSLLHRCFSRARDLSRSEVLLCGATPIYLQHRCRRQSRLSSTQARSRTSAAKSIDVDQLDAPSDYWTCGYRNVQMLVGHLLQRERLAAARPFGGKVPDVASLQAELERLWSLGYDPDGCQQLGGCVRFTQKWIGTSEACVLLRGQKICCNVVSFRGGGPAETDSANAAAAVVEYALKHFRGGTESATMSQIGRGVVVSSRPPLYLQHDGHSRTIVGVQRRHEPTGKFTDFLLVLDPALGEEGFRDFVSHANQGFGWERIVKRSLAPLRRKGEYELLVVDPDSIIGPAQLAESRCVQRHL